MLPAAQCSISTGYHRDVSGRLLQCAPWVLCALSACRTEGPGRVDVDSRPTTTRIHIGQVKCSDSSRQDARIRELNLTARPVESMAGHTDVFWTVTHGGAVKLNPLARVRGSQIVIDPNIEFTGRRSCPVQQTFRTRFPRLSPGSYDIAIGDQTFHVQVP